MDRECYKCVYHTNTCTKWGCQFETLEEHDNKIRAKVISQMVVKLEANMPSELDENERYGYTVALTSVLEELKENK